MDDIYIDRVLARDTEAFRYFLTNYKDMAFNVALAIVKDDHYAEEVVQDAFMKAFGGLKSFKRTAQFKSWLYRIVVNESFRHLNRLKREHTLVSIDEVNETADEGLVNEDGRVYKIRAALKLLPSRESLALTLFYLEEHRLAEIVTITGWSLANTKVILHRARKNLRTILEGASKP